MRRGLARSAVVLAGLVAALLIGVPAQAAPVSVTADSSTWQADGRVDVIKYSADATTMYIGGVFHHLCPPLVSSCTASTPGAVAVDYLAALDVATGQPITSWRPQPDGEVESMALSTSTGVLYVGGLFRNLSGLAHRKVGAVNAATGAVVDAFRPNVNGETKALALSPDGGVLYAGGTFGKVNGLPRTLTAAMTTWSPTTPNATLLPWNPAPSGSDTVDKGTLFQPIVNTLVVRPDGQVYVGGVFTSIGGQARSNVAAIEPATTVAVGNAVAAFSMTPSLHFVVLTVQLTRDGTTLFASGRGPGGFLRAYDSTTGTQLWARRFDGDVQSAVATDTIVYIGGHFDNIAVTGTSFQELRHHLAAVDAATGATDPWNPTANSSFGVNGMAWSPGHVAASGDFTLINRVPHQSLATFSGGDAVPPTTPANVTGTSTVKGRVDVSWDRSDDSDSPTLTYRVYRRPAGGSTFALLASVSGPSSPGGQVTYADLTGTIGASYEYIVRAADPVFLSAPSAVAGPVTVAGDQAGPGQPTSVVATSPANGTAHVTWQGGGDSDDATVTYTLTRWTGTTPTSAGTVVGPVSGAVSFDDYIVAGGTFTYTVSASDGTFTSADSAPSGPVVVPADTATPTVPTGLTVTSPSPNSVSLTWNASTDADGSPSQTWYLVSRKVAGQTGNGTVIAQTAPGVTSYSETGGPGAPAPDITYTYYVAATDGPRTSAKTAGVNIKVRSSIFTDDMSSLASWALPPASSGVTLDSTVGHTAPPAARLVSQVSPRVFGYAHRDLGGAYRTVCVLEWVSVTSYDTRSAGQTTLLRVYSQPGNAIARLYIDGKGTLWIRSDWGSNPATTKVVVPADGSWHSAQLCTTSTPDAVSGTLQAWWDGGGLGTFTAVDNSPDPLSSIDIGDTGTTNSVVLIDDVSVGTTKR